MGSTPPSSQGVWTGWILHFPNPLGLLHGPPQLGHGEMQALGPGRDSAAICWLWENSAVLPFCLYWTRAGAGSGGLDVPLLKAPRSPLALAELQSLNWEARDSKSSSPDLIF